MRLKLYRAPTMAEAMACVRGELGADALILGTRRCGEGIEVTAALEPNDPPPPDSARAEALSFHAVPQPLRNTLAWGPFEAVLQSALSFGTLELSRRGPPLLFTGPPGAGKTLTTARLATRIVLGGGTPLVITADGRRAGATEQLAAFTRLLGIGLTVAAHPVTLSRALAKRPDGSPVLIDAFGCDPFDPAQAEELRALTAAAAATLVLVMPAGLDPAEAADVALAYAEAGASHLIVTRLDLTRRLGGLLAAAATGRLPLTEAGVGPGAADGLVPLTPAFLAERLMQTGAKPHARPAR